MNPLVCLMALAGLDLSSTLWVMMYVLVIMPSIPVRTDSCAFAFLQTDGFLPGSVG